MNIWLSLPENFKQNYPYYASCNANQQAGVHTTNSSKVLDAKNQVQFLCHRSQKSTPIMYASLELQLHSKRPDQQSCPRLVPSLFPNRRYLRLGASSKLYHPLSPDHYRLSPNANPLRFWCVVAVVEMLFLLAAHLVPHLCLVHTFPIGLERLWALGRYLS